MLSFPSALLKRCKIAPLNYLKNSFFVTCSTSSKDASVTKSHNGEWILRSPYSDVIIPEKISISEYLFHAQEKFSDRVAVVDGDTGQEYKYNDIRRSSLSLASSLARLGYSKGDIVGLVSPNGPEFIISLLGLNVLGTVVSPINHTYTVEEIQFQLETVGCVAVICHPDKISAVREACQHNRTVRHIISTGPPQDGILSLQTLLKDDGKGLPNHIPVSDEDIAVIPFSSGTTGLPKGVMLTNRNLIANTLQTTHPAACPFAKDGPRHTKIGVLPMFHSYGMWVNIFVAMSTGVKLVTMRQFEPQKFLHLISEQKPTLLPVVPPMLQFLANHPAVPPRILDSVEVMLCGAAPLGHVLLEMFFKKFGPRITFVEGYGMTELSPVSHLSPLSGFMVGSCGVPVSNTFTKLINPESGLNVGPDVREGELCIKGPQVMKGYFKNEKATKETIKDGWLCTGDVARIDENNQVFIVDRLKELIKVKGLQVAPAELENLLRKHPGVADVAVIGVPDERSGELPRAFVVPKKEVKADEEQLKDFVAQRVSSHKKLDRVIFIDEIPKSAAGKILRKDLRKLI